MKKIKLQFTNGDTKAASFLTVFSVSNIKKEY